jgi:hypothetical protein
MDGTGAQRNKKNLGKNNLGGEEERKSYASAAERAIHSNHAKHSDISSGKASRHKMPLDEEIEKF